MFVLALFMVFSGFYAHAASLIHNDSAISVQAIGNKIDNKGQQHLHSLLDAPLENNTNKTVSFRDILEGEAVKNQKTFNTMKDDLRLTRERNAYRRQNWLKNDGNGEKAAKLKRESDAKPAEQAQNVPNAVVKECLLENDLSVNAKLKELDVYDLLQIITCLQGKYNKVNNLLEIQLARCDSYQLLLGIRNEFENELMNALYPEGFPATKDQYLKCVFVMVSQTGLMVEEYRRIVEKAGFTFDEFCSLGDKQVYSPKSEIVHKIQIPDHCLTIDHYKSIVRHDKNLQDYINGGHKRDEVINTILELRQARLHPKKGTLGTVKFPETTGKCILISNVPFVKDHQHNTDKTTSPSQSTNRNVLQNFQKKNRYMPVEQIRAIFRATEAKQGVQTICETKESNDKRQIIGKVLVEFIQPRQAALGMIEHQNTVNKYDITTEFVRCEDFECADEDIMKYQEKY